MKDYKPYFLWTKKELISQCEKQLVYYGLEDMQSDIIKIIYDDKVWDPITDFNGCSVVQDKFHPYIPCLIHDYRWISGDGGRKSDTEFRVNLIKFGTQQGRAWRMYLGVRIGWFFRGKNRR